MKISEIMNMIIDPRPEVQSGSVAALIADDDLFGRCQTFVNMMEPDDQYGGYSTDEIRLKWERRAVAPYMEHVKRETKKAIRIDERYGVYRVKCNEITVSPEYYDEQTAKDAASRLLLGIVCGLNPRRILWEGAPRDGL